MTDDERELRARFGVEWDLARRRSDATVAALNLAVRIMEETGARARVETQAAIARVNEAAMLARAGVEALEAVDRELAAELERLNGRRS